MLSGAKKDLITSIAGTILIFLGVGMYISLWLIELPKEMSQQEVLNASVQDHWASWYIWVLPIIPMSFGSILLFAVGEWIKKVLHISDKASDKFLKPKE